MASLTAAPVLLCAAAVGCALSLAACGSSDPGSAAAGGVGAGGSTIPASGPPKVAATPVRALRAGAPRVVQFAAPRRYWCLPAHPGQAQATIGWSVPSATKLTVALDGRVLHQGIRRALPFAVPAGKADGIGVTIVFACAPGSSHTVTIRWRAGRSATTTRTVTIGKAKS